MKKTLSLLFDLVIIVCLMLVGMVIEEHNQFAIWIGALGGLVVHKLLVMFIRAIRDYIFE